MSHLIKIYAVCKFSCFRLVVEELSMDAVVHIAVSKLKLYVAC